MNVLRSCVALLVLAVAASTQQVCWQAVGVPGQSNFGSGGVARIGDADGDGWRDLVARAWVQLAPGSSDRQVWTLSGRTGLPLRVLVGQPSGTLQRVVEAGDVDGDGCDDYATGINNPRALSTAVEVRSGRDDTLIWSVQGSAFGAFGSYAILGGLDLDGDGRPDVVVKAPGAHPLGELRAFDSRGNLLWVVNGTNEVAFGFRFNSKDLGRVGDVDGDGCDDLVSGGGAFLAAGSGVVISGRTGTVLTVGYGQPGDQLGYSVDGAGDVDADGVPDFVLGNQGNGLRGGVVAVFSGKNGARIREWTSADVGLGFEARTLRGGLDVNLDGVPDVIVGAPLFGGGGPFAGAVFVLSGRDGSAIFRWRSTERAGTDLGQELVAIGVEPGSSFPRFGAVEPKYCAGVGPPLPYKGRISVLCGAPPGVGEVGPGCAGTLERQPRIGIDDRGDAVRLHLSGAPPATHALLLLGTSTTSWLGTPLPLPLDSLGFAGCRLLTSIEAAVPVVTGLDGIARGYAFVDVPAPLGNELGLTLHGQWLVLGRGRLAPGGLSGALSWTH